LSAIDISFLDRAGFSRAFATLLDVVERDPAGAFLVVAGEERVRLVNSARLSQPSQLSSKISEIRIPERSGAMDAGPGLRSDRRLVGLDLPSGHFRALDRR